MTNKEQELREAAMAVLQDIESRVVVRTGRIARLRKALDLPCLACNNTGVRMHGGGPCACGKEAK